MNSQPSMLHTAYCILSSPPCTPRAESGSTQHAVCHMLHAVLYDFFHRYFSPSGSIYFQHIPAHKNIYEKVYTDDRDVVLFWCWKKQFRLQRSRSVRCQDPRPVHASRPLCTNLEE